MNIFYVTLTRYLQTNNTNPNFDDEELQGFHSLREHHIKIASRCHFLQGQIDKKDEGMRGGGEEGRRGGGKEGRRGGGVEEMRG